MPKFRKKPVVIEAFQWVDNVEYQENPVWFVEAIRAGDIKIIRDIAGAVYTYMSIQTLEGAMAARPGDWIICGVKGEIYTCKAYLFHATYEAVE